jgi:hypothetical protein
MGRGDGPRAQFDGYRHELPDRDCDRPPVFKPRSRVECSGAVRRVSTIAGHGLDLDAGGGEELPELRGVLYDL